MERDDYESLATADLVLAMVDGAIVPIIKMPDGGRRKLSQPVADVSIAPGGHALTSPQQRASVTFVFPIGLTR